MALKIGNSSLSQGWLDGVVGTAFGGSGKVSISFWWKPTFDPDQGQGRTITFFKALDASSKGVYLYFDGSVGNPAFLGYGWTGTGGTTTTVNTPFGRGANVPYHIYVEWDGSGGAGASYAAVYIDGALVSSSTVLSGVGSTVNSSKLMDLGRGDMYIQDFAGWTTNVTAEVRTALSKGFSPRFFRSSLHVHYRFWGYIDGGSATNCSAVAQIAGTFNPGGFHLGAKKVFKATAQAAGSVQDTVDATAQAAGSVKESDLDKTAQAEVRVVDVFDATAQAQVRVITTEDKTAQAAGAVSKKWILDPVDVLVAANVECVGGPPIHAVMARAHDYSTQPSNARYIRGNGAGSAYVYLLFDAPTIPAGYKVASLEMRLSLENLTGGGLYQRYRLKFGGPGLTTPEENLAVETNDNTPNTGQIWRSLSWGAGARVVTQQELDDLTVELEPPSSGDWRMFAVDVVVVLVSDATAQAAGLVLDTLDATAQAAGTVKESDIDATATAIARVADTHDAEAQAKAQVQETVDATAQAKATVFTYGDATANAQAWVAGQCRALRPNATVSNTNGNVLNGGDIYPHQAVDDTDFYPNAPASLTDYLYENFFGSGTTRMDLGTFTLPVYEQTDHATLYAYITGNNSASEGFGLTIRKGGAIVASTSVPGPFTNGWQSLSWACGSLTQSEIDGLEIEVSLTAGSGSAEVRCHVAYLELCTIPLAQNKTAQAAGVIQTTEEKTAQAAVRIVEVTDATAQPAASVRDTVEKTAQAASSVKEVDIDKTAQAKAQVRDTVEASAQAKVDVKEVIDSTAKASAEVVRFASRAFLDPCSHFRTLVEVDWPGGSRRYADTSLAIESTGYDGRLCEMGRIVQSTNGRRDSLTFKLENTDAGATVESLWSAVNPPEGSEVRVYYWFEGDPLAWRVEVFRGVVEHIESLTEETVAVSAFSVEEKYDVLLGAEVNRTDFPDAPDASVGKMKPIIFGTLDYFEGVPVTEVGKSALAATLLKSDTTAILEDGSRFANSGTIIIGTEEITYTGKSGNTLTGLPNRTATAGALDYAGGAEVREKTALEILVASHAVAAISAVYGVRGSRMKLLDAGLYTTILTAPAKVSFAGGWPTIDVPAGGASFAQAQFDAAGAGNTATNPANACADAAGWTEKNYASVASGQKLVVDQTTDLPAVGDILRAYLMVEYDGSTVGAGTFTPKIGATSFAALMAAGNLPLDLKNRAGALGMTRAYDDTHTLVDPTHTHSSPSGPVTESIFFDSLIVGGNWANYPALVDGSFVSPATVLSPGGSGFNTSFSKVLDSGKGTPTAVVLKVRGKMGSGSGTFSLSVPGFSNVATAALGTSIATVASASIGAPTWAQIQGASAFPNAGLVASTDLYEVWLEVTYQPFGAAAAPTSLSQTSDDPITHTVAYLADVTSLAAGDWTWFKNRSVEIAHTGTAATLKVVRVCFVVEYAAYRQEPVDRILVAVQGLIPSGDPTDILKQILTNAALMGQPSTIYDAGDLAAAQASHQVLPFRLDFAITKKIQAASLIAKVCAQSRLLFWWEAGRFSVAYEPALASFPSPVAILQVNDFDEADIERTGAVYRDVIHEIVALYRHDYREGNLSRDTKATQATTTGQTNKSEVEYDLIRDDASAANLVAFEIERKGKPRFALKIPAYLTMFEIRRGEVLGITTARVAYRKVQVTQIEPDAENVTLRGPVWD